jgi:DNA gyrase/topoisomerase IV subunit B
LKIYFFTIYELSSNTKMAPKTASKTSAAKPKPRRLKVPSTIVEEDSESTTSVDTSSSVGSSHASARSSGARKSKAELAKTYQKLEHREQILLRPDSYIGSVENERVAMHVLTGTSAAGAPLMELKELLYNPGLYKIVDEVIVNARDHHIRSLDASQKLQPVTEIRLDVNAATGRISVFNNGSGIDIEMHPEHKVYIPELIFGHLLTSTNYDDSEKRVVGGRNGYGAKLTNIFSKEFVIETLDTAAGKTYRQVFSDNMKTIGAPEIASTRVKRGFTRLTFLPDYTRFGMTALTADMLEILRKRAYDLCACTGARVNVFFNDEKLDYKNFERYVDLYLGMKTEYPRVYEEVNDRWEVAATYSDAGYRQVSFVNGINTFRGGRHVDMIQKQICDSLVTMYNAKKKKEATALKAADVKQYLWLFVNATIENPRFSGQTKEELSSTQAQFGSRCELSDKFLSKLYKSGIIERAMRVSEFNAAKGLSKLGGKKKVKLNDVEKLEDANRAGGRDSAQCTLILTEGDSAKAMAVDGVSAVNGRDYFGIFPLKGKLLNVKDATPAKIAGNKEISDVMKIVGLQVGKDPKPSDLRYGKIMILADSDSVSGDTPLLLRRDGQIHIETIDALSDEWSMTLTGKEYGSTDFEVWTEKGWTGIRHVMRHKVSKRMFRVLTHTGLVDVTEDHSLITNLGVEIAPKDCEIGDELLHSFPRFEEHRLTFAGELHLMDQKQLWEHASKAHIQKYQAKPKAELVRRLREVDQIEHLQLSHPEPISDVEAYTMGLFWADGSTGVYTWEVPGKRGNTLARTSHNWYISNTNMAFLERAKAIMVIQYDNEFSIVEDRSNRDRRGHKNVKNETDTDCIDM